MSNEKILRNLSLLYDFMGDIDSKCDIYMKELPKNLEYHKELIEYLKTLQSVSNDIMVIIEILGEKFEYKNNKGVKA